MLQKPTVNAIVLSSVTFITGLIFFLDAVTPIGYEDSVLYLIPLFILSLLGRVRFLYSYMFIGIVLTIIGCFTSPAGADLKEAIFNRTLGMGVLVALTLLLVKSIQTQALLLANKAIQESEARARERASELEALIDAIPAFVFLARDPLCLDMQTNRMTREKLQVTSEKCISKCAANGVCPQSFRAMKDGRELRENELPVQLAASTGRAIRDFELTLECDQGRICELFGNAVPLLNSSGQVRGAIGVFIDIRERKELEAKLHARDQELSGLINSSPDCIGRVDRQLRHLFINPALSRMTGKSSAEFLGKSNEELGFPAELCKLWNHTYQEAFRTGKQKDLNFTYESPQQGLRYLQLRVVPEVSLNGSIETLLFFTSDHTELRIAQEELKAANIAAHSANTAKSLFLANMSHEIRTPLNAIIGFTEFLADSTLSSRDRLEYSGIVARSSAQLLALINDILDLSRVESGQMVLENDFISLGQMIEDIRHLIKLKTDDKALNFTINAVSIPTVMVGDSVRIQQILVNLLNNAVKFTSPGGNITLHISTASDGRQLEFIVQDTGIGIDPSHHETIFEPFSQAEASTSRRFGGTGLGLSLSRNLARIMGGDIVLKESRIGFGSSFAVTLPVGEESLQQRTRPAAPSQQPLLDKNLQGKNILLAEDSEDSALLVNRILTLQGALVEQAANGQIALDKALKKKYDVILMDMQMPIMDGLMATRQLRKQGYAAPIIALSANALKEEVAASLAAGCNGHLAKPFKARQLIGYLAQLS